MSDYAILALIALLLTLGAFIALRSGAGAAAVPGARRVGTEEAGLRLVAGNFSAMLLRVLGYLVILVVIQSCIGFPTLFFW
jgi:hypothetical protein